MLQGDYATGPPQPIVLVPQSDVSSLGTSGTADSAQPWDEKDVLRVACSTACVDLVLIRRVLAQAHGELDLAIEKVIEALAVDATPSDAAGHVQHAVQGAAGGSASSTNQHEGTASCNTIGSASHDHMNNTDNFRAMAEGQAEVSTVSCSILSSTSSNGTATGGNSRGDDSITTPAAAGAGAVSECSSSLPGDEAGNPELDSSCALAASGGDVVVAGTCAGDDASGSRNTAGKSPESSVPKGKTRKGVRVGSSSSVHAAAAVRPGNNKACPCGSKKKYKNCCGVAAAAAARRRDDAGSAGTAPGAGSACGQAAEQLVAQLAALVI